MTTPTQIAWAPRIDDQVILDEPTSDPASAPAEETAWRPRIVAEDDQVILDEPSSDPDSPVAAGSVNQTVLTGDEHPSETGDEHPSEPVQGSTAAEPRFVSKADAESSPTATVPSTEPGPASTSTAGEDDTNLDTRWHEILATFVDEPRSSVELAASLTNDRAEALVLSVTERQHSLLAAWQGDDTGTEQLRIALQQYHIFSNRLEDLFHGD